MAMGHNHHVKLALALVFDIICHSSHVLATRVFRRRGTAIVDQHMALCLFIVKCQEKAISKTDVVHSDGDSGWPWPALLFLSWHRLYLRFFLWSKRPVPIGPSHAVHPGECPHFGCALCEPAMFPQVFQTLALSFLFGAALHDRIPDVVFDVSVFIKDHRVAAVESHFGIVWHAVRLSDFERQEFAGKNFQLLMIFNRRFPKHKTITSKPDTGSYGKHSC